MPSSSPFFIHRVANSLLQGHPFTCSQGAVAIMLSTKSFFAENEPQQPQWFVDMLRWNWLRDFLFHFGLPYKDEPINMELARGDITKDRRVYAYHIAKAMNTMQEDYADRLSTVGHKGRIVCEAFCAIFAPPAGFPSTDLVSQINWLKENRGYIVSPNNFAPTMHTLRDIGNKASHLHLTMHPSDKAVVVDAVYVLANRVYDFYSSHFAGDFRRALNGVIDLNDGTASRTRAELEGFLHDEAKRLLKIRKEEAARGFDMSTCEGAMTMLTALPQNHADVAEALRAVTKLTRHGDGFSVKLIELGADSAVVEALRAFSVSNAAVAKYGCMAIRNLALVSDELRDKLMAWGSGAAVVAALDTYHNDAKITALGCGALCALAAGNDSIKRELVVGGAGPAVVAALEAFALDGAVVSYACKAICHLAANSDGKEELMGSHARVAVATALSACKGDANAAKEGCRAICHLFRNSGDINLKLMAGYAVLGAMKAWRWDAAVAKYGCRAICQLTADSDAIRARLMESFMKSGAGEAILMALNVAAQVGDDAVAKHGCDALMNFCRDRALRQWFVLARPKAILDALIAQGIPNASKAWSKLSK